MLLEGKEKAGLPLSSELWGKVKEKMEEIENVMDETIVSAEEATTKQFRYLIGGAVFFIFWHTLEMYIRSI